MQAQVSEVRISNGRHGEELYHALRGEVLGNGWSGPREQRRERLIGIQYEGIGRMMWGIDVMGNYVEDIERDGQRHRYWAISYRQRCDEHWPNIEEEKLQNRKNIRLVKNGISR